MLRLVVARRWAHVLSLAFATTTFVAAVLAAPPGPPALPDEARLQARVLAPCCWLQTLDIHESPLATTLREEIHTRLAAGERADRIEDDLAERYGERVRAVPKGSDRRAVVPVVLALSMTASGVLLAFALRRWRKNGADSAVVASTPTCPSMPASEQESDLYDQRLEDELRALE